jgi:hypothetical protein
VGPARREAYHEGQELAVKGTNFRQRMPIDIPKIEPGDVEVPPKLCWFSSCGGRMEFDDVCIFILEAQT